MTIMQVLNAVGVVDPVVSVAVLIPRTGRGVFTVVPVDDGPSADELAAIDHEMPLIRAEMDLVDAEIRVLTVEPHPSELDWRRLRRAERRVAVEALALLAAGSSLPWVA